MNWHESTRIFFAQNAVIDSVLISEIHVTISHSCLFMPNRGLNKNPTAGLAVGFKKSLRRIRTRLPRWSAASRLAG